MELKHAFIIGFILFMMLLIIVIAYKTYGNEEYLVVDETPSPISITCEPEPSGTSPSTTHTPSDINWAPFVCDTISFQNPDSQSFICGTPELDMQWAQLEISKYADPIIAPTPFIETLTPTETPLGEPYYKVSEYNRSALIHLLYFEACSGTTDADILEQHAIVSVVFNRLISGNYPHCYDASDIIFYRYPSGAYAFSPADNSERFWKFIVRDDKGNIDETKSARLKADYERNYDQLAAKVDYVIAHGPTVPENVLYFVSNDCYATSSYFKVNHKVYAVYDDTTFMTNEKP